jgi:hypothetical protein
MLTMIEEAGRLLSTDVYGQHDVESKRRARARLDRTRLGNSRGASSALVALTIHALDQDFCLEKAHTAIFEDYCLWAQSSTGELVFCLSGPAGSTLSRRICQSSAEFGVLAASFFVDSTANPPFCDAATIVHSIAYQMALHDSGIKRLICAALRRHPDLTSRRLQEQITLLMVQPIAALGTQTPLVIVIDALDSCAKNTAGRDGLDLLRHLIAMLSQDVVRAKYKILITTRALHTTQKMVSELNGSYQDPVIRLHTLERQSIPKITVDSALDYPTARTVHAEADASPTQTRGHTLPRPVPTSTRHGRPTSLSAPTPNSSHPWSCGSPTSSNVRPSQMPAILVTRTPSGGSHVAVPIQAG